MYVVNRRTVWTNPLDQAVKIRERLVGKGRSDMSANNWHYDLPKSVEILEIPRRLAISTLVANSRITASGERILRGPPSSSGPSIWPVADFCSMATGLVSRPSRSTRAFSVRPLLVHDEAHLEPAFQKLIKEIGKEQDKGEGTEKLPWPKLAGHGSVCDCENGDGTRKQKDQAVRADRTRKEDTGSGSRSSDRADPLPVATAEGEKIASVAQSPCRQAGRTNR